MLASSLAISLHNLLFPSTHRLMLTPRVLGTSCCVLLLQVLCWMKKLLNGVKQVLSSGPSSRGSDSRSGDNGWQDSP
jgi:hypothetical protein